jgi:hypothetical protein
VQSIVLLSLYMINGAKVLTSNCGNRGGLQFLDRLPL